MNSQEGIILALAAGLIWGSNPIFIKKYGGRASELAVNAVRGIYAALALAPLAILTGRGLEVNIIGLLFISMSALTGPGLGDYFYVRSIRAIGGGNAITIGYLYVFVSQITGHVFLGEELPLNTIAGGALALLGIYLVYRGSNNARGARGRSLLYAIITAVAWGISATFSKLATRYGDPIDMTFFRNVALFIALLPLSLRDTKDIISTKDGALLGLTAGALGFGIGMALFITALSISGLVVATLPTMIAPITTRLLSALLFEDERAGLNELAGTALVVAGIWLGSTRL